MNSTAHREAVVRQFTAQATPFARCAGHHVQESLEIFRLLGNFTGRERVLDSGCGPGIVSRFLARHVASVVGIDLTLAMTPAAEKQTRDLGLTNATFIQGDMTSLPFAAEEFDAAVSRYAFHHLESPILALSEMGRVTRVGGKVIVVDVAPMVAKKEAYDAFERQRDSSHASALTMEEWISLGERAGLGAAAIRHFDLPMPAEALLESSFPEGHQRRDLMAALRADIGIDELGFRARYERDQLIILFPIAAFCWEKARSEAEKNIVTNL